MALQACGNVHVTQGCLGVDVCGCTTPGALDHLQADISDRDLTVDPIEFAPGWHPVKIDISTKPQRVGCGTGLGGERLNAFEIDQREDLCVQIGKAVALCA